MMGRGDGELMMRLFRNAMRRAALVAWVTATGCGGVVPETDANQSHEPGGSQGKLVQVAQVEARDFERSLRATGTLVPRAAAVVRALISGPLVEVGVDVGSPVRRGELLFRIRPDETRLAVESSRAARDTARANLEHLLAWTRPEEVRLLESQLIRAEAERARACNDAERAQKLLDKGAVSQSQWESYRTACESARSGEQVSREQLQIAREGPTREEIDLAKSRLAEAEARTRESERALADTAIGAPFDGVVNAVMLKVGDFVNRGQEVLTLANLDVLEAEMRVPEILAGAVVHGSPVDLEVAGISGRLQGEVVAVSQAIDPQSRTCLIKVELANPDGRIKGGAFCTGVLKLPSLQSTTAVPLQAVQARDGRTYVWAVEGARARRVEVQVLARDDRYAALESRLEVGAAVVTGGGGALAEGDAVSVGGSDSR